MQYSQEARELLCRAADKARNLGHSYVGSIHLLMALTAQRGFAGYLLTSFGIHQEMTAHMAVILYGSGTPGLQLHQGFTKQASIILRGAAMEAKHSNSPVVEPVHIFLSLLRRDRAAAADLIRVYGVDPLGYPYTLERLTCCKYAFGKHSLCR